MAPQSASATATVRPAISCSATSRSLGDTVTRMDRIEPDIVEATPGDPRDTTSPRAIGTDHHRIVLGDALPTDKHAFLRALLERTTTGTGRIRAAIPQGWTVADKTGTGDHGTINDIALVWPPGSAPLVLSIMSSNATENANTTGLSSPRRRISRRHTPLEPGAAA